jgi:Fe-S-cluster-containing hydrogenase component 2
MSLKDNDFVKIICAAGNQDHIMVHNISLVYTMAGADCIDMNASPVIVEYAKKGVELGLKLSKEAGIERQAPILCVSVGMEGDHHLRKARVTKIGENLTALIASCPVRAIVGGTNGELVRVIESRCIGVGTCDKIKPGAIEFYTPETDLTKILPECISAGATMIELHANTGTVAEVLDKWKLLNTVNPTGYNSLCLGRAYLSNKDVVERIEKIMEISGERTIVQADGNPMTGFSSSMNCTVQAVAMGDIVMKMKNSPLILLSGGTNLNTAELVRLCGVKVNGLSFGSNARAYIQKYLTMENLAERPEDLADAVKKATHFVDSVKKGLRG